VFLGGFFILLVVGWVVCRSRVWVVEGVGVLGGGWVKTTKALSSGTGGDGRVKKNTLLDISKKFRRARGRRVNGKVREDTSHWCQNKHGRGEVRKKRF